MGFVGRSIERGFRGRAAAGLAFVLVVTACGDSGSATNTTTTATESPPESVASTAPPTSAASPATTPAASCSASNPARATETDWPSYGFDDANSRYNPLENRIEPGNVACLQVLWSIDGLSGVTGTPVVVDGVVYFGDWNGTLHAVDASTGAVVWEKQLGELAITATVVVTENHVYASDADGVLYARDRTTGSALWTVEADNQLEAAIVAAPVLIGDMLVLGMAGDSPFVVDFRGSVLAVDADTGAERWRVDMTDEGSAPGAGVWTAGAVDRTLGLVFFGTGNTIGSPVNSLGDSLVAIDYEAGELIWHSQLNPDDFDNADIGASPNLFTIDGREVVGVGSKIGLYRVVDRATGDEVWSVELTEGGDCCGVYATAAVGDGTIYVNSILRPGTAGSITFALDSRDGSILWERPLPSAAYGSLTLANGMVIHGTVAGTIYALDATDGTVLWSDTLPGNFGDGISVVNGTLFVGYGFSVMLTGVRDGGVVAYTLP